MYIWKVTVVLNSGKELHGYFECKHDDATSAARELLQCAPNTFNSIVNKEKTEQTLFKTGDVSALILSAG